jgi:hypothetical protein
LLFAAFVSGVSWHATRVFSGFNPAEKLYLEFGDVAEV